MSEHFADIKTIKKLSNGTYPISIIIPVKNEAGTIERLIEGLENQTYQPAEIVITDGNSNDATREIIRRKQKECLVKIVLIETEQAYPGRGRNLAMYKASQPWFACIDAGIVPHKDWLENLVLIAEKIPEAKVVYGSYRPQINNSFTGFAAIVYVPPSNRRVESIASCLFHNTVWKTVGDFREDLRSAEDLLFFQEIDKCGFSKAYAEKAIVEWAIQPDFGKNYHRFKIYSQNGMKAGLFFDWQFSVLRFYTIITFLFVLSWFWPFLICLPILLFILRAERRIFNWYHAENFNGKIKKMINPLRIGMIVIINLTIDIAMMHGIGLWFWYDYMFPQMHEPLTKQK